MKKLKTLRQALTLTGEAVERDRRYKGDNGPIIGHVWANTGVLKDERPWMYCPDETSPSKTEYVLQDNQLEQLVLFCNGNVWEEVRHDDNTV